MKEQFDYNIIVAQLTKLISFWQANLSQIGFMPLAVFVLALLIIYLKNSRVLKLKISLQKIKLSLAVLQMIVLIISNPGFVVLANEATESARVISEATESAALENIGIDINTATDIKEITNVEAKVTENSSTLTEKVESQMSSLNSTNDKIHSAIERVAGKLNKLAKKTWSANEKVNALVTNPQNNELSIEIIDPKGQVLGLATEKTKKSNGTQIRIAPKANFTPGKYTLKVTDTVTKTTTTQDFSWGVLAINPNKAVYTPGEKAKFAIGVLDDKGMMVCDASLILSIKYLVSGKEKTDELSSENGDIKTNPECNVKDYTLKPDFEAEYTVGMEEGEYQLTLSAKTPNGTYSVTDRIDVKKDIPFIIERETATRIYPVLSYPVGITVTANQDFQGTVTDIVPESFEISPYSLSHQSSTSVSENDYKSFTKVETVSKQTIENQNVLGASTAKLPLPFEGDFPVTGEFGGESEDPELDKKYAKYGVVGHDGIDFDLPKGTEVLAVDNGEVVLSKENSDYGTTVVIQHSWGKSYYGHLSKLLVEEGQKVTTETKIALSGDSGLSTGAHLHFSVKPNSFETYNGYYGKVDPAPLLGLDLKEKVLGVSTTNETIKIISWNISVKKGETIKLGYNYKAPNESPQYYTLGSLKLFNTSNASLTYTEGRQWQIASDLVVDNGDGLLAYGESANTTPRLRTYTNATNTFSSESGTVSSTAGRTFIVKTSPTKQEAIVGHVSIDGSNNHILQISCYDGTSWSNEWTATIGSGAAPLTRRAFDIAYETSSGDVMVSYSRNSAATNAVDYRTKSGSTGCGTANWATAASFPTTTTLTSGTVHWVKLAWDRRSAQNLITAIWADSASDLGAAVWSGTAWGNLPTAALETSLEVVSAAQDVEDFDVEYESNSGDVMVVWANSAGANGTNGVRFATCTGGTSSCTWSAVQTPATFSDDATNLDLSANPASSSNEMVFASIGNAGSDLQIGYWSGSAWTNTANVDTGANTPLAGTKLVSTGWLTAGSTTRSIVVYADNEGGGAGSPDIDVAYYIGNGSTFSVGTDFVQSPAIGTPYKWFDVQVDPFNTNQLMLSFADNNADLFAKRLSMSATPAFTWTNADGGSAALEASLVQSTIGDFSFAYWRNYWSTLTQRQGIVENDQNGTNLSSHVAQIGERLKVKIQVDTDIGASRNKVLKLQYDKNDNSWVDVKPTGEIRPALSVVAKGQTKFGTGDAGSCTSGTTAKAGYLYEDRSETDAILFKGSGCYDINFLIDTQYAVANTTYRFRLYNVTDNASLSLGVSPYPSFTTVTSGNDTKRYSASNTTALSSDYADLKYMLDKAGYDNVSSDNAAREILQNVSSDTTEDITFNGEATNGNFGGEITTGDVNADGHADLIVGAFSYDNGGTSTANWGRVYVYFGGPNMDTTADVTITGETAGDLFGTSLATGDFNGDGNADLMVSAPWYNNGATADAGKVYVYYGGSSVDSTADVSMVNTVADDSMGLSIASGFDLNKDGFDDIVAGSDGGVSSGTVRIYYGNSSQENTADLTFTSTSGASVSGADDVNGDGYPDIVLQSASGVVQIYYGGQNMDTTADVTINGVSGDGFGNTVSGVGDVNGDGFADIIAGAPFYSTFTGRAYIYYGGSSMDTTVDITLTGTSNSSFGSRLSSAGDINGDGYADVLVGSYGYSGDTGRAYVYYGATSMDTTEDITITGTATSRLGSAVEVGDLNSDGLNELIIGAESVSTFTGSTYIYHQSYTANGTSDKNVTGAATSNFLGREIANVGDVNNDGYEDILVGAYGNSTSTGIAYLYMGGSTISTTPTATFTGGASNDRFGEGVGGGGDVNGDGYDDIIIGAPGYNPGAAAETGRAYIFYGSSTISGTIAASTANVIITGNAASQRVGFHVTTNGDVNGDGNDDALIAADGYSSDTGRVYYFSGRDLTSSMTVANATATFTGIATNDAMGASIAMADINYDGKADVFIGSDNYNSAQGRGYIFYGGNLSGDETGSGADFIVTGETVGDQFGKSFKPAGDINGDGYPDIVTSAYFYNPGGAVNTGRVYIFYGSSTPFSGSVSASTADVKINGEATNHEFGHNVISGGDVNGDGYSDILAGAYNWDNGGTTNVGKAYVYYGNPSLTGTLAASTAAAFVLTGEAASNKLGEGLASADVNNDGYTDLFIGADGYSTNTGRAYFLMQGSSTYYPVYNFAAKSSSACSGLASIAGTWGGQSNVAPSSKNIKLQIYRFGSTNAWEDINTDSSATTNSDISITGSKSASLSEYCDGSNWAYFRTYQDIGTQSLQTDNFSATFTDGGGGPETPTLDKLMRHGRWFNSSGAVQPFSF